MLEKRKLANHPYAKCHVGIEPGLIVLVSYTTPVIFLTEKNGCRFVECTGTYSQTTRKQIGYFLKEYAPDLTYQAVKAIVGQGAVKM